MKNFLVNFFSLAIIFSAGVLFAPIAKADEAQCFCSTGVGDDNAKASCEPSTESACANLHTNQPPCVWKASGKECSDAVSAWNADKAKYDEVKSQDQNYGAGNGNKIIPPCALADKLYFTGPNGNQVAGPCGDVSIFVILLLNASQYLFTIIGALALAMFVYGGFMMILSQGNSEKVKKGTGAIVAAVVGLVIAFGGYALIKFLGEAVGVTTNLL